MSKSLAFAFLTLFELVFITNSLSQTTFTFEPAKIKIDSLKKVISENHIEVVFAYDYPHNEDENLAEAAGLPDEIIFSNDSITLKGSYFDIEKGHFVHYIYTREMAGLYQYKIADIPANDGMTIKGLLLFFTCKNAIYISASFDTPIKNNYPIS